MHRVVTTAPGHLLARQVAKAFQLDKHGLNRAFALAALLRQRSHARPASPLIVGGVGQREENDLLARLKVKFPDFGHDLYAHEKHSSSKPPPAFAARLRKARKRKG